ncbi:MAG TPA: choice-of-anchor Q domain-containing protein [Pyrinomonadaceae bacterium]
MKTTIVWAFLLVAGVAGAFLTYLPITSSRSTYNQDLGRIETANLSIMPPVPITLNVDRADDTAGATACTAAANDCSLRGAVIKANTIGGSDPVIIALQPATTYNLTLSNATQENAAATGDLDITTSAHTVTIAGGGSAGANASIIDAAGLNTGTRRDRVFHITNSKVNVTFRNLAIRNGQAADGGAGGASTNPTAQNANRTGGGILNNGGTVGLDNVLVQSCQALGKGDSVINDHTTLDAFGGGLASVGGTANLVITNSIFAADSAVGGKGGDFNNGAGSWAKGGAIYFEGGTLNITGSRIENSSAIGGNGGNQDQNGQTNGGFGGTAQGGGAWIGGGTVTIGNTTFKSTTATGGNSGTGGNGAEPAGGADGGGLYIMGNVTITNSTFNSTSATGGTGGNAFGTMCFGAHNAGDGGGARGGAIFGESGSLIINTATFGNNSAKGGNGGNGGQTNGGLNCGMHGAGGLAYGGAITNNTASVNIQHVTIAASNAQAGNTGVNQGGANKPPRPVAEGAGGGIRVGPGTVALQNTIIAGNKAANGLGDASSAPTPGPNVDGTITSNGHNLLGVATDAGGFVGVGDKINANPMLAALANNGGPTQTMALLAGSAAVDAGVAAGSSFDQRGQTRTVDDPAVPNAPTSDSTDIGAFERQRQRRCYLRCPPDITVPSDSQKRGAIVKYKTPFERGCGRVVCRPASGSFFPLGQTTVVCKSATGEVCRFTVTVKATATPRHHGVRR